MPVIAIISASHCNGEDVSKILSEKNKYQLLTDDLIDKTSKNYSISKEKLQIAMFGSSTLFSMTEIERNLFLTYLKLELLKEIQKDNLVYYGYAIHLIDPEISNVLKVCIIAQSKYRIKNLTEKNEISEKEARNLIKHDDRILYNWTNYLFNINPTDKSLYDIIIPINKTSVEQTVELIQSNTKNEALALTEKSKKALDDSIFASKVLIELLEKKHNVDVKSNDGNVEVYVKKFVLFFEKYKKELVNIVKSIDGVKSVEIKISKSFKMPSIAREIDFEAPQKILLVDDEVEFVQTLSERLKTRNIDSTIAYNGEEALERFDTDPPEVMILDLKMPGINGLEVLEKVKAKHPSTEVIILTGHGSKNEEQIAFELGAFAYLEKPVDISVLSETMKKAYDKVNKNKNK